MFPSSKYIILIPLFLSLNQTWRLFDLRSRLSCYQTWQCLSCHECCSLCFTKVCIQCQKLDTVFIFVNQFGPTPFNHRWCKIFSEISSVVIESDAGCMLRIFLVFTRPTNSTVLCWFHIFSCIHFSHLDSKRLSWSAVLNSLIMESFSCGLEKKTVVFPAQFNPCYLWSNYSEWFTNSSHELCSTVVVTRKWWLVLSLVYPLQTNTIKPPSAFLTRFVAQSLSLKRLNWCILCSHKCIKLPQCVYSPSLILLFYNGRVVLAVPVVVRSSCNGKAPIISLLFLWKLTWVKRSLKQKKKFDLINSSREAVLQKVWPVCSISQLSACHRVWRHMTLLAVAAEVICPLPGRWRDAERKRGTPSKCPGW